MSQIEQLSEALRSSLVANEELKRLNRKLANASREPIAIVATSCRLPGGVTNADALWDLVEAGGETIGSLPLDRGWQLDELLKSRGETRANPEMWQGGFLNDAHAFDAAFFGISDREALAMDPQHRLLLETTWEVIENGGIIPESLKKTSTGVFIGTTYQAYVPPIYDHAPELDGYRLQGGLPSMASGRISYAFGLNGPAITVDTACSSSLVAIHLAVQSLRAQECSLAIAGGATIVASPEVYVEFARQNGLAADGRCKAFADTADGTAFSEGVGMVLLARLSDAIRLGHPVLALICGSAMNHDGASNGLTAPSGPAQEKVIAKALKNAGLTVADIDIVEAHGTGTSLGDPIEANALINTYGRGRPQGQPLWLGSLKSNVGHLQAASGVAGLIKMVMALRHGVMPKTLHADLPSSKIEWSAGSVSLINEARPWPERGHPRRAAVSSFGFSGTNSHIILEQAPQSHTLRSVEAPQQEPANLPHILPVSGASPHALKAQAGKVADFLRGAEPENISAICAALATQKTHFDHRAACLGANPHELITALDALTRGEAAAGLIQGTRNPSGSCAFLFSGQGSQWAGMGRQLHSRLPIFARHLDRVACVMDMHLPHPLKQIMFAEAGSPQAALLDRTDYTQPALFAIEVALYRTLEELGIKPDFLCGHSIGEIAAAHVTGVFSLEDAAKFVRLRGRLMQDIQSAGAMLAIEAKEAEVMETLAGLDDRISMAAINAPNSIVISGDRKDILSLAEIWKARGARTTRLNVSHAFHSPHIASIVSDLHALASSITLAAPTIPIVSTVTGALLTDEEACSPRYWADQARLPVLYADAIAFLHGQDVLTYFEVGPDAVLATLAQANINALSHVEERDARTLAVIRRGRDQARVLASALADLHVRGLPLDWSQLGPSRKHIDLPTYAFQRRHYWYKPKLSQSGKLSQQGGEGVHPFLQPGITLADGQGYIFAGRMGPSNELWMLDHAIDGVAINAGATTAELILSAGSTMGLGRLDSLILLENLPLFPESETDIQLRIGALDDDGSAKVDVYFRAPAHQSDPQTDHASNEWSRHATARLLPSEAASSYWLEFAHWPPHQAEALEHHSLYAKLEEAGVHLGPAFQLITSAWRKGEDVYVEAELPASDGSAFRIHPALLDAGLQASLLQSLPAEGARQLFSISGLQIYQDNVRSIRACVRLKSGNGQTETQSEHSVRIADHSGAPVAQIASIVLRSADPSARKVRRHPVYRMEWTELFPSVGQHGPALCWITPEVGQWRKAAPEGEVVPTMAEALAAVSARSLAGAALLSQPKKLRNAHDALEVTLSVVAAVQAWLADPVTQKLPLIVVTQNAIDANKTGASINLAQSPLWGLLRCVQWEHPNRIVLLDVDTHENLNSALPFAWAAVQEGEVQLAIRKGHLLAARLGKHSLLPHISSTDGPEPAVSGIGTALITGAGSLGALVARHLVQTRQYERIVLASRRGPDAPGLTQMMRTLPISDIEVRIEKCDVSDRAELERLIDGISGDKPLKAILHTAGISDPLPIEELTPDAISHIMRPKVDAAWALHELTKNRQLDSFILFSSAVGAIGLKDQSHYGAANSFLDALATYRHSLGLPATSLSWGMWDYNTEMGDQLGAERLATVIAAGYRMISPDYGLAVIDAALKPQDEVCQSQLIPARFDLRRLEARSPSALLAKLSEGSSPRRSGHDFMAHYRSADESSRPAVLMKTVTELACKVLRNPDPSSITENTEFRSLGFDSLTSIEIVAELSTAMGLSLPVTAVFDHPTPRLLVAFLQEQLDANDAVRASGGARVARQSEAPLQTASTSFGSLMLHAIEQGRATEGRAILKGVASFRPMFKVSAPEEAASPPVWLSQGSDAPLLICVNSFIPSVGDYTYRRLANALTGKFNVAAISLPGYADAEVLPASVEALGASLARTVRLCAGDRPFTLAGFSTGGLAAYAAAEHLQDGQNKLQSLILIDSFHPKFMTDEAMQTALGEWVKTAGILTSQHDAGLTAMAWYLELFLSGWRPKPLEAPVCLIQAKDGLTDVSPERVAEPWGSLARRVTVPGRHFTLLREDVTETAAHVVRMSAMHGLSQVLKDEG